MSASSETALLNLLEGEDEQPGLGIRIKRPVGITYEKILEWFLFPIKWTLQSM